MIVGALTSGTAFAAVDGPDGPRIAYLTLDRSKSRVEIRAAGPGGGSQRMLVGGRRGSAAPVPEFGWAPSWSPDGRRIAFGARSRGSDRIFLVSVPGGEQRPIPNTEGGFAPVFAPDGRSIAFARARIRSRITFPKKPGDPFDIYSYDSITTWVIRLDGSGARRLTPWRDALEVIPSSFSPDGSVLAVSERDERRGLLDSAVLLEVGRAWPAGRRLIAREATRPSFSPDGSRIALITYLPGVRPKLGRYGWYRGGLTVIDADGSKSRTLVRTSFDEQSPPSWDPSGQRLAYTEGTSVIEVNADGTCRKKVFEGTSTRLFYGPLWQPGPDRAAGRIDC